MIDCESFPSTRPPSLYLDYGADAQECEENSLNVSERGMQFRSRWRFEIGAQLAVSCVFHHPRLGAQRVTVEGTVVWCERTPAGCYDCTILFLELPDELKESLREFSFRLAKS